MFTRLHFVTIICLLLLLSGGCASDRAYVITVTAEASAYERTPFTEHEGHATVTYKLASAPRSCE